MPEPAETSQKGWVLFFGGFLRLISIPIILLLVVYNIRRLLFSLTAILSSRKPANPDGKSLDKVDLPSILILIPCRDEEEVVEGLCKSIKALDYPPDYFQVVLVNDGSKDASAGIFLEAAGNDPHWHLLNLPVTIGKAAALNEALRQFTFGEIVYIFDADHRPEPSALRRAVRYFQDEKVAGVSGRTLPSNPTASPSAYYASVESYLHQMVTMRAKDRLDLAPALLGSNCGYRRSLLAAKGGFRKGALLEDSDLTLSFYRSGYRVRFAEDSIAYHQVPETVNGYLKQHIRWSRGFNDVTRDHAASLISNRKLPAGLRAELFLFSTGYLDRIALASAGAISILSFFNKQLFQFPLSILSFALLIPLVQIVTLFTEQRLPKAMWIRIPLIPLFYILDIYAAVRAMTDSIFNRARIWSKTERVPNRS